LALALALVLGLGLAIGLTALAFAQATPSSTQAGTTIPVNTTTDELNNDGDCSLREAVQAASTDTAADACPAGNGWDTISIPAGTYQLTLAGAARTTMLRAILT
jgi:CSLREA domain-containing protein